MVFDAELLLFSKLHRSLAPILHLPTLRRAFRAPRRKQLLGRESLVKRASETPSGVRRVSAAFIEPYIASVSTEKEDCHAVIVEGLADQAAVRRAGSYAVFVLGSSTWVEGKNAASTLANLSQGLPQFQKAVVLMDPDFAGRRGRNTLETAFPGQLWHAFIPAAEARSQTSTKWHGAGNLGVEHASPKSIRYALARSRLASAGRKHFTREMLMELGLAATHDNPMAGHIRRKRDCVCDVLGIGACDGKQLLRQLNVYNFTKEDVLNALQEAKLQA